LRCPTVVATAGILCLAASSLRAGEPERQPSPNAGAIVRVVDSVLAGLTLQEKIGQLVQYSGGWSTGPSGRRISDEQRQIIRAGQTGSLLNVTGAAETHELQRIAVEESRARIPLLFGLDVIHGFKTTFPIPLAEAASWDPTLSSSPHA